MLRKSKIEIEWKILKIKIKIMDMMAKLLILVSNSISN